MQAQCKRNALNIKSQSDFSVDRWNRKGYPYWERQGRLRPLRQVHVFVLLACVLLQRTKQTQTRQEGLRFKMMKQENSRLQFCQIFLLHLFLYY